MSLAVMEKTEWVSLTFGKWKTLKKYRLDQVGVRKEPVDGKTEMTKIMHSHEPSAVAVSTV